jgi:metal-dependent amidase/aminoacylase/carboxypeptidase family protein
VKATQKTILKISREVWNKPAIGLREQEAMEVHIRELEAAGFTITSRNSGGHPTAFIAQWSQGSGGPKLGFLPEYDALPGLGNAAEPRVKPAGNGLTDGHGCGHNCLGAGCTGAAIALKAMMLERNVAGTLRVYGCGAEENVGAKIFLAKAGLFDDLDPALAWHLRHERQPLHARLVERPDGPCRDGSLVGPQCAGCGRAVRPRGEPDAGAPRADGSLALHLRDRRCRAERRARRSADLDPGA